MVCDDTSLLIITDKPIQNILLIVKRLKRFTDKHRNVKEIIISFFNQEKPCFSINKYFCCAGFYDSYKKAFIGGVNISHYNNIIIYDDNLFTKPYQINKQIKKLRKCDILLPNRLNNFSKTYFYGNNKVKISLNDAYIKLFSGLDYDDINNPNKAFRKKTVFPLLKSCNNNKYFWIETVKKAFVNGLKISVCETHYYEEKKVDKSDWVNDLIELTRIKIKK